MWEHDVPLAPLVRYRIGGPAAALARPGSAGDLREALRTMPGPVAAGQRAGRSAPGPLTLGAGANVLVSDRGIGTPVLVLGGNFADFSHGNHSFVVGAAVRLPTLVREARRAGARGYYFLEAVPGTVGGALRMNAGTPDRGLWDLVEWAEAVTPDGDTVRVTSNEARPGYRSCGLPHRWVFARAKLSARPGDPAAIREKHRAFRDRKVRGQVYELPSVGSIWKNPGRAAGSSAWETVSAAGMRGAVRGGARIAERHANFIVNLGGASSDDVLGLMAETRGRVGRQLGVDLKPEIQLWGFSPEELASVGAAPPRPQTQETNLGGPE